MIHSLEELRNGSLLGIKKLKIVENLKEFPEEIFSLDESLELLDLSGNRLSSLPDLSRLKKLKIAFFSDNLFTEMPSAFKECKKLFMLGMKANKIGTFDEDILPLSISWLILTDNRLKKLPNSIGKLTKMQKFPLAGNQLETLPLSMQAMKNLELIRLSANNFKELPQWLLELPKLAWLAFSGNPCSLSKEVNIKVLAMQDLELDKLLGEGASGKIYRAHSKELNSIVAVKLFKGAVTSDGYAKDEMNACMSAGAHPNLIKVLARLEHKHLGLVLEFIEPAFKNLGNPPNFETCSRDTYKDGLSFSAQEVQKIAQQIASVSAHLHAHSILHGDLYAHNILIDEKRYCYLGDFGAASFYEKGNELYEKVEVLAFGNLLEDLLQRVEDKHSELYLNLIKLQSLCQEKESASRPLFIDILKGL